MQPRRQLTQEQILAITNFHPPDGAARFSKQQLQKMGLPYEGGGLVRIHGKIYTFVSKTDNPLKTHILGEGGFGKLKLLQNVEDPSDQKALKVLGAKGKPYIDPFETYEAFQKELDIAEQLGRGSKTVITKIGEAGHTSYCGVLDIAPGQNLSDYITNTALDIQSFLNILYKCCLEIKSVHNIGYVHCDIKFENFMYDPETGKVKIIDFGLARKPMIGYCSEGTLGYVPPEAYHPRRPRSPYRYDFKNDVYALGVMLHMFTNLCQQNHVALSSEITNFCQALIDNMAHQDFKQRWTLDTAIDALGYLNTPDKSRYALYKPVAKNFERALSLNSHSVLFVDVEDGVRMICRNAEDHQRISSALRIVDNISQTNKNEIIFSQDTMDKLMKMTPDQISLLMRISEKYNALPSSSKNKADKDKRAVLKLAANYIINPCEKTRKAMHKAMTEENKKWAKGFFRTETLNLLISVGKVMIINEPLNETLATTPRKRK